MMGEFLSKDERYSTKKTFAISFGYAGTEYCGYQLQYHNNSDKSIQQPYIAAVENDVRKILGMFWIL